MLVSVVHRHWKLQRVSIPTSVYRGSHISILAREGDQLGFLFGGVGSRWCQKFENGGGESLLYIIILFFIYIFLSVFKLLLVVDVSNATERNTLHAFTLIYLHITPPTSLSPSHTHSCSASLAPTLSKGTSFLPPQPPQLPTPSGPPLLVSSHAPPQSSAPGEEREGRWPGSVAGRQGG